MHNLKDFFFYLGPVEIFTSKEAEINPAVICFKS